MTKNDTAPTGEERLKSRRRTFWRYVALAILVAIIGGMLSGAAAALYEDGVIPLWLPLVMCALVFAGLVWFTWEYFRWIDELDRMDNLWAHLIGSYGCIFISGVWFFAAQLGLIPPPDALAIISLLIGLIVVAYVVRKLGLR